MRSRTSVWGRRARAAFAAMGVLLAGCDDPVVDAAVDRLGDEVDGVPQGPTHRSGQPCLLCHSEMTVAGTVFQKATNDIPVEGVQVHLTDSAGATHEATTNCVGNFYVTDNQWDPVFPLLVSLSFPTSGVTIKMESKIGREGACAACHSDPKGPSLIGHVYLDKEPTTPDLPRPARTCGSRGGG